MPSDFLSIFLIINLMIFIYIFFNFKNILSGRHDSDGHGLLVRY